MGWLLNLINPVGAVVKELSAAYAAHENAQTDQEKIHWDGRIKALEAMLSQNKAAMAYRAFWIAWLAFVLPLAFYFGKIVAWDSALGYGSTAPLHGDALVWAQLIIANVFPSGAAVGIGMGISQAVVAYASRK